MVNHWQKPVLLLQRLIKQHMFDEAGDGYIVDAGCGSGSATIAALLSGMNAIAYDKDPAMVEGTDSR